MTQRARKVLFWVSLGVVLLADQLTKLWVVRTFTKYVTVQPVQWLEPVFSFTHVENTGVAFGLLPQLGGVLTVVSTVIIAGLLIFYLQMEDEEHWLIHLALGAQIGGAIGNLVDRFARGAVVDFIDANFWPFQAWPIFNIADSSIVVGVGLLLLAAFLEERALSQEREAVETPGVVMEDEEALHA
jgi:signal peptidase II